MTKYDTNSALWAKISADEILKKFWNMFLIFSRKLALKKNFMQIVCLFSEQKKKKNKKNIISLSAAEFNYSIVSVKNDIYVSDAWTHCILNRLFHTIYWKSSISILGTSGYKIYYIFLEKNG